MKIILNKKEKDFVEHWITLTTTNTHILYKYEKLEILDSNGMAKLNHKDWVVAENSDILKGSLYDYINMFIRVDGYDIINIID